MKLIFLFTFLFISVQAFSQTDSLSAMKEILKFQTELNADYLNKDKSPLAPDEIKNFKGHQFFRVNLKYCVKARLVKSGEENFFKMPTSTQRFADYRKYGELHFEIAGEAYKLNIYQSADLLKNEAYQDYLFLPFTDLTTGDQTYGAGRYIGLRIPKSGNELVLDFNQAYNPFCAYSRKYSCPLVPKENRLSIAILAGVRGN